MPINLNNIARRLGDTVNKHQVGIYVTIIFHLLILIIMVMVKIDALDARSGIEIEYVGEEKKELQITNADVEALKREKQSLEDQVNEMLRHTREQLRNVVVDEGVSNGSRNGGSAITGSGAQGQVLEENEELQRKIAETHKMLQQGDEPILPAVERKAPSKKEQYSGPSVMSYKLEGRHAYSLPVPVYKCETGGTVVVNIVVAQRGTVTSASIDAGKSAVDICLHEAAKQAALLSRFSVSASSKNQDGTITYRFVAQ